MNIGAIFAAIFGAASEGVLWGIMVMGVYLTYRILDFADLTVDGSF
ncbi:MAG: ABC transporter permease, partial [Oscillospiraceae bacterium]